MSKIPVGATIAHAYRFVFQDFLKIVSIIWLPWLILSLAGLLLRAQAITLSEDVTSGNFADMGRLLALLTPLYLVSSYFLFMQIAGVTQQALALRTGSPYYYLTFAKPVWRLIGAFLLTALILIGLYLVFILAGAVLGVVLALAGKFLNFGRGVVAFAALVAVLMAFCVYIYILVRLTFLLNPIVIAESHIDVRRSWSLGKGNVWRMVLIFLAVLVPVTVAFVLALHFWTGGFPPIVPVHASPDQIAANKAATAAWWAAAMKRSTAYWYIVYPVNGLMATLIYGLACGAQCFAYRALVPAQTAPSANPL